MDTLERIRAVLSAECGVDAARVTASSNLLEDLGIDSLDLLNAAHRLEREMGVPIPVEAWLRAEYAEIAPARSHFVVATICEYVEAQRAAG